MVDPFTETVSRPSIIDALSRFLCFVLIIFIAEVAASLPVSNAWPERGASALKIIKTKQRNRLSSSMIEGLLTVSVNGPTIKDSKPFIKRAVKVWLSKKKRRNLPTPRTMIEAKKAEPSRYVQDASMQTEGSVCSTDEMRSVIKRMLLEGDENTDDSDDDKEDGCCDM